MRRRWLAGVLMLASCNTLLGIGEPGLAPPDAPGTCARPTLREGDLVLEQSATEASVPLSLPVEQTILLVSVREAEPSPTFGAVVCELLVDSLRCRRGMGGTDFAGSDATVRVHWTTVTFSTGVTVQRGLTDITTSVRIPIARAPLERSFIVLTGILAGPGNSVWGSNEFVRAGLADPETLELRNEAPGSSVGWQVVTMDRAVVQRGVATLGATETVVDASLQAVDFDSAVPLVTYTADNGQLADAASLMVSSQLSATKLSMSRRAAGPSLAMAWEVVTLPFSVQHGRSSLAAGTTVVVDPAVVSTAAAVALSSNQSLIGPSGGDSAYTQAPVRDLVGEALFTLAVTSRGLEVRRSSAAAGAEVDWSVVDFSSPRCAP